MSRNHATAGSANRTSLRGIWTAATLVCAVGLAGCGHKKPSAVGAPVDDAGGSTDVGVGDDGAVPPAPACGVIAGAAPPADGGGASGEIVAFPGAEGFGRLSRGGRGGGVCHVTNLADSGPGSLRACVSVGNRTVVFDVGGWITLNTTLNVYSSNLTLAGQTAPGGGIGVRGRRITFGGANVVVRFMRFRRGVVTTSTAEDTVIIASSAINVIVDHCSVGFGIDESFSMPGDEPTGPRNLTVQWTMNGYALQATNHSAGSLLVGNDTTIHHTLWALNKTSNPRARTAPGAVLDWVNNVIYGWNARHPYGEAQGWSLSYHPFIMANTPNGTHTANAVGNVFVSTRPADYAFVDGMANADGIPAFNLFFADNLLDGNANGVFDTSKNDFSMVTEPVTRLSDRLPAPEIATDPAVAAYERVLDGVGATLPARDEVDQLLISHVRNQTGLLITTEADLVAEGVSNGGYGTLAAGSPPEDTDCDGMPDAWEIANGLDPGDASDRNGDPISDGYTNLERYLGALVPPNP